MTILDQVAGIVASAAGPVLFKDATLKRVGARTSDGRGGFTQTPETVSVKALVTDYSSFIRASAGIPPNERRVLVLSDGLANAPAPEDKITVDGRDWTVIEVANDPAKAVYECRCR